MAASQRQGPNIRYIVRECVLVCVKGSVVDSSAPCQPLWRTEVNNSKSCLTLVVEVLREGSWMLQDQGFGSAL